MKKIFNLIVFAVAALGFTACEDVPAPYDINLEEGGNGGSTSTLVSSTGLSDFTTKTVEGAAWSPGASYAKASGYNSTDKTYTPTKAYIISPKFSLAGITEAYLTYDYALRYTNGISNLADRHKCLVSADYSGDVTTANWIQLDIPVKETGADANNTWLFDNAGSIALPAEVMGKSGIVVAFYFECESSGSTTWEIKNLKIAEGSGEENGNTPSTPSVESTREKPLTVADAIATQGDNIAWVKAYIVGSVPGKAYDEAVFGTENAQNTNIIVADSPTETDANKCMPVQLPSGDVRNLLNIVDNGGNLGKEVLLYGTLTTYFNKPGIKSVTYAEIGDQKAGKDPDVVVEVGEAKGDGTANNPFNIAAAIAKCEEVGQTQTTTEYYVEGIVSKLDSKYANSFSMSDDGTTNIEFKFYNGLGLGGATINTGDIKVGDKIVAKGYLVNYYGNTPELCKGCTIISINGETSGTVTPDVPDTPSDPTPSEEPATPDDASAYEFDFSAQGYENAKDFDGKSIEVGDATLTLSKASGGTTPKYYNTGTGIRLYGSNTMVVASEKTIAKVEFTYATGEDNSKRPYYATASNTKFDSGNYDYESQTWTGSSKSFTMTYTATGGHLRIQKIKITYAQ